MAFSSEKRKAHLAAILNGFGVRQEELTLTRKNRC